MAEQATHNRLVAGSSPAGPTVQSQPSKRECDMARIKREQVKVEDYEKILNVRSSGTKAMVELAGVKFDRSYQRDKKKHSEAIARKFNPSAVGSPLLGRRSDGSLYCIDGQQRIEAMKSLGITHWMCDVVESAGPAFEAQIFYAVNKGRVGVNALDTFKAALTGGDPHALAVVRVANECGLRVPLYGLTTPDKNKGTFLVCYQSAYGAVKTYGEEPFKRALSLIVLTWPLYPRMLQGNVIMGLTQLIHKFGDKIDDDRFHERLKEVPSLKITQFADAHESGRVFGVQVIVVKFYNVALRSNKIVLKDKWGEVH